MNVIKLLAFLLFVLIPLFFSQASDKKVAVDLVYEGSLARTVQVYPHRQRHDFKTGNFTGDDKDELIIKGPSGFQVLQFVDEQWEKVIDASFINPVGGRASEYDGWAVGDLNRNGRVELYNFAGQKLGRYEWGGNEIVHEIYDFPYNIDGAAIGNIDYDSGIEMVILGFEDPEPGTIWTYLHTCICEIEDRINIIWEDKGKLKLWKTFSRGPTDRINHIADYTNRGNKQLLIQKGRSDMGPAMYNLISWDGFNLKRESSFLLGDGEIIYTERYKSIDPFADWYLSPIEIAGEPAFVVRLNSFKGLGKSVIMKGIGGDLEVMDLVVEDLGDEARFIGGSHWMDIDGKGRGLLSLKRVIDKSIPIEQRWLEYKFYRLRLVE